MRFALASVLGFPAACERCYHFEDKVQTQRVLERETNENKTQGFACSSVGLTDTQYTPALLRSQAVEASCRVCLKKRKKMKIDVPWSICPGSARVTDPKG